MKKMMALSMLVAVSALPAFLSSTLAQQSVNNSISGQVLDDNSPDAYGIIETSLPCEEVNQIAHRSLKRLGYSVDSYTPAVGDQMGLIKASRNFVWGDKEPVTVKIACKAEGIDVDARPEVPPCEQANRIARLAVERLEYEVTEFTPAATGKPGVVKGRKEGQPAVYISLFCEGRMVTMDTNSDSPLLKNREFYTALTDFRRGFFATYKAQRRVVEAPSTPPSDNQVRVVMQRLSQTETKAEFGLELTTMVAVQVEITNPTKRTYQLEPEKIMLVNITGERAHPVKDKENAFPVSALTSQSIAPGATVKGYLYYPAGVYTGARGSLTEEKSQEREGFETPFQ